MKEFKFTNNEVSLLEKALRHMISNLQYEQHQARLHGCSIGSYDAEIEEYRKLKEVIQR